MTAVPFIAAILGAAALAHAAPAQDVERWTMRAGVHPVQPKTPNHPLLQVGAGAAITFGATYMHSRHWGVELFASLPVEHDLRLAETGKVGSVKHVPRTLSLQRYFFDPNGGVRVYVGAGLNYTVFFDERTAGTLAGRQVEFSSSFGPAAQLGLDLDIGPWFIGIDGRWFDIDSDASLDRSALGTIQVDPYAFGISIGRRLR